MKANKEANSFCIDDEEATTLEEALQEASQEIIHDLNIQKNHFTTTIKYRLNELGRIIKEIKIIVECAHQVLQSQNTPVPSEAPET